MKKVKVRIYKDQYGKGGFINPTKKFLQKAAYGMQVGQNTAAIEDIIIEELRKKTSNEDIADLLETEYNIPYYQALDAVDDVVDYIYDDYANEVKNDEGYRSRIYKDTEGFLTIGYGLNLDAGISEDNLPWNWNPDDDRQKVWKEERKIYGFDERDTWSLDYTITLLICSDNKDMKFILFTKTKQIN
jgi:hypothetical protein